MQLLRHHSVVRLLGLAVVLAGGPDLIAQVPAPTHSSGSPLPSSRHELPNQISLDAISSEEFKRFIGLTDHPQNPNSADFLPLPLPTAQSENSQTSAFPMTPALTPGDAALSSPYLHLPKEDALSKAYPPEEAGPWWQRFCSQRLLTADPSLVCRVDLEQLIWQSMQYSPRVQSILIVPKVQRTEEEIARGGLDPNRFAQSLYHNTSDPVGNTLTTGGPSRLNEEFWENSIGIRDRNSFGGKSEFSQLLNARDNNSLFFQPKHQADTKLSLNYSQPLLRGSGKFYNTSAIRLAGIKTNESIALANRKLQDHTMELIVTYWDLVLHRYLYVQALQGKERLKAIKEQLQNREGRDLLRSQLSRATAAIARQQGQMEIALANVKERQEILRRLVNSPELEVGACTEIIPLTHPQLLPPQVMLEDELYSALLNRGDILAIQRSIETIAVQRQLARNELRSQLDWIADGYVRGLQGDNDFAKSFGNQFDSGRPSFSSGLVYQNPIGNRAAKANMLGRDLEYAKLLADYSDTLKKARAEIVGALEASKGTFNSAVAAIESTHATKEEVEDHQAQFMNFFSDYSSVSFVLNELMDAENRLIDAENAWATRQIQHMQAIARIKFAAGTLMTISAE